MTQQDKELLLKDLCARLPYECNIKLKILTDFTFGETFFGEGMEEDLILSPSLLLLFTDKKDCVGITPYLRPLSSMTDEETELFNSEFGGITNGYNSIEIKRIDWLNAKHFDYRELIEKGLALEAPEGMYNN